MKISFLGLLFVFSITTLFAQPPQTFKYQGVVRDTDGDLISNQAVDIRISIRNGSAVGTIVYQEYFIETTNQFGLVSLNIGTGTVLIGTFSGIDWGSGSKYMQVDYKDGANYLLLGTTELSSVPYALYSNHSADSYWGKTGNNIFYNSGNVGIGTDNPAAKLEIDGAAMSQPLHAYSTVYDAIIGSATGTASSGVFGEGLSASCFGVYGCNLHGGIGIRGKSTGGWAGYFDGEMYVSGNIGLGTTAPAYPFHLINSSGINWIAGFHNTSTSSSSNGVVIRADGGNPLLVQNNSSNLFIVRQNGHVGIGTDLPSTPLEIISPGVGASLRVSDNSGNALFRLIEGSDGTAGLHLYDNNYVTKVYLSAGGNSYITSGSLGLGSTVPVNAKLQIEGAEAYDAMIKLNNTGTNGAQFFMGSTNSAWGGGANQNLFVMGYGVPSSANIDLVFNATGQVGIATTAPTQTLDVNGGGRYRNLTTGTVYSGVYMTSDGTLISGSSDIRLKDNIEPLKGSLEKVAKLQGVSFTWKANPEQGRSIGFIAQDFERVVPELAFTNQTDGNKGINYAEVTALLVEAIKEQQKIIETLQSRIEKLEEINLNNN